MKAMVRRIHPFNRKSTLELVVKAESPEEEIILQAYDSQEKREQYLVIEAVCTSRDPNRVFEPTGLPVDPPWEVRYADAKPEHLGMVEDAFDTVHKEFAAGVKRMTKTEYDGVLKRAIGMFKARTSNEGSDEGGPGEEEKK